MLPRDQRFFQEKNPFVKEEKQLIESVGSAFLPLNWGFVLLLFLKTKDTVSGSET